MAILAEQNVPTAPPSEHAYGPEPDQFCRVHIPAAPSPTPLPVAIVIHGGYWKQQWNINNAAHMTLAPSLVASGAYVAVELEYRRLGSGGGYPTTQEDAAACLASLPGLAAAQGWAFFDFSRVVVIGHSAGGHLALWLADHAAKEASATQTAENNGDGSTSAAATGSGSMAIMPVPRLVVAIAPVADMVAAFERKLSDEGNAAELYMRCRPDDGDAASLAKYRDASPMHRLPLRVEAVVATGAGDKDVPMDYVVAFAEAAAACAVGGTGQPCELVRLHPDDDHYTPVNASSGSWGKIRAAMDAVVAKWG